MKKAQVTIFVLILVLIVAGVSSVFILRDSFTLTNIPPGAEPIYNSIFSCVEETGDMATYSILAQGGIYEQGSLDNLLVYKLAKPIPNGEGIEKTQYEFTKKSIGNGIEILLNDIFDECINDIDFNKFNQEIIFDEFNFNVEVENKFIIMNLDFPIIINKGNVSSYMSSFTYRKKVDIKIMEDIISQIVDKSIEDNDNPYDLIESLEQQYDVAISWFFLAEEYSYLFNNGFYILNFPENNYVINFVIEYDWDEIENEEDNIS
tara:strand:+ start:1703 stop:2488 length:786 start_codon:yes stop_codon:yes gene_type:complete